MVTSSRWSLLIFIAILVALTLALMFDDVILYLIFERLLEWKISWPLKITVSTLFTLCNFALALLIMKSLLRRSQTGAEGMVGATGIVERVQRDDYLIKTQGELWQARASEKLALGEKVMVKRIEGLTLDVERWNLQMDGEK